MKTKSTYFTPDFRMFFEDLKVNNNKEWFKRNKHRYDNHVAQPFNVFIDQILRTIQKQDNSINITVDEAVFRIHRDLRFTKDKSPYKIFKSALISPKGRKSKEVPGLYLEMGEDHIKVAGGCFKLNSRQISKLEDNYEPIELITNKPEFISCWGELIKNKYSLTYQTQLPSNLLTSNILDLKIQAYWQKLKPVIDNFKEILQSDI